MSEDDRIGVLEKAIAELQAQLDALKPKAEAGFKSDWKPRRDPTEGMSMDANTMRALADAVGGGVLTGVVNDARRRMEPSSVIPKTGPEVQVVRGSGWQPERPLEGPPGQDHIKRMMDQEDAVWRRDLAKKLSGE